MAYTRHALAAAVSAGVTLIAHGASPSGDPQRGAQAFAVCTACHSTQPGRHLTGPSLADVWQRRAGTAKGYDRYSDALKHSGVTWSDETLDRWLANPQKFIPGNAMSFAGIPDATTRHNLIAYLRAVSEGKAPPVAGRDRMMGGGMMGSGMMGGGPADLRHAPKEAEVTALTHCRDTYTVTTADGTSRKLWEYNLRLKTDSSKNGPQPGKPVITGSGMMGDRASLVFATPAEIGTFIRESCD